MLGFDEVIKGVQKGKIYSKPSWDNDEYIKSSELDESKITHFIKVDSNGERMYFPDFYDIFGKDWYEVNEHLDVLSAIQEIRNYISRKGLKDCTECRLKKECDCLKHSTRISEFGAPVRLNTFCTVLELLENSIRGV